ncbi:hypothetical protein N9L76_06915 [bacterium]|nr:hypothetical protein [bacterium]|tara:strand:+ start:20431 stop:22533 length:2103 start_codon:yes stop_codon:yes gene_type:complete
MGADLSTLGLAAETPADGPQSMTDEEYRARSIGKMDVEMRRKYGSKGGKYNFKVVVRGDSSTGKSMLLRRLRGGSFIPGYTPSPEIKTAHIQWQARSSPEDNVMLEVWDVVDKASKRDVSESLTLAHKGEAESGQHTFPLDATMIDVYQNCHAAVFLIDPSKKWTYEYVQRELPNVPEHVPTCILINFRDYPASKRLIRSEEIEFDVENLFSNRPFKPFIVETSLLNCYGLSALSTFLHIPFLCLKRASIEQALALNTAGVVQAQEALKTVKSDKYEEYEKRIEETAGGTGGGSGGNSVAAEINVASTAQTAAAPASPEEAAITWEKLSKTTLGEAPILLGSAAVSGLISGVSTIAAMTPAKIAANASSSVSSLASLETLGIKSKPQGNFDATEREKVAPQFSHLAGRGGAAAAAFGGEDIDDSDLAGPTAGMTGGGEHPDVGPFDDNFFQTSPKSARKANGGDDPFGNRKDWDEDSGDDESDGDDDGDENENGDDDADDGSGKKPKRKSSFQKVSQVVRWDDDDDSSDDEAVQMKGSDDDGSDVDLNNPSTPKIGVVRQISAKDPFFGTSDRKDKKSDDINTSVRAAEVDLDPSAIAAAFGTPSADAYEQVDDSADFLNTAITRGDSGDLSKSDGAKASGKKKKKDKKASEGAAADDFYEKDSSKKEKKKKKKEKKVSPDTGSLKKSKKIKDWDESESD